MSNELPKVISAIEVSLAPGEVVLLEVPAGMDATSALLSDEGWLILRQWAYERVTVGFFDGAAHGSLPEPITAWQWVMKSEFIVGSMAMPRLRELLGVVAP